MARERMVTRTVMITEIEVMCLNVENAQVQIDTFELTGTYTDTNAMLKAVKKLHETDTFKCVAVQTSKEKEILYGMPEIEFIKLANVLPPRGTNKE